MNLPESYTAEQVIAAGRAAGMPELDIKYHLANIIATGALYLLGQCETHDTDGEHQCRWCYAFIREHTVHALEEHKPDCEYGRLLADYKTFRRLTQPSPAE